MPLYPYVIYKPLYGCADELSNIALMKKQVLTLSLAKHDQCPICKQLGSGRDAELLGVSPGSKLFDIQITFSPTLIDIEAI